MSIESLESDVAVISRICCRICMYRQRNIYQSRMLDLLRNCLSDGQDGGCKQRGQTATIWLKALLMPRLAVCSRDLHWHWINWTLLCDTMEVSMLRLAWLPITQHVFQPAKNGVQHATAIYPIPRCTRPRYIGLTLYRGGGGGGGGGVSKTLMSS